MRLLDIEDDVAEHLDEAAVGVIGEARVLGALGQSLDALIVEAEVQNRVHHAGHGKLCARAHGDEQGVGTGTELLALQGFELLEGSIHLVVHVFADLAAHVLATGFGLNRESRRNRETSVGHLSKTGALATKDVLHLAVALGLAAAEGINVFDCTDCRSSHSLTLWVLKSLHTHLGPQPKTRLLVIPQKEQKELYNEFLSSGSLSFRDHFAEVGDGLEGGSYRLEQTEARASERFIVHHHHYLVKEIVERAANRGQRGESFVILLELTEKQRCRQQVQRCARPEYARHRCPLNAARNCAPAAGVHLPASVAWRRMFLMRLTEAAMASKSSLPRTLATAWARARASTTLSEPEASTALVTS